MNARRCFRPSFGSDGRRVDRRKRKRAPRAGLQDQDRSMARRRSNPAQREPSVSTADYSKIIGDHPKPLGDHSKPFGDRPKVIGDRSKPLCHLPKLLGDDSDPPADRSNKLLQS